MLGRSKYFQRRRQPAHQHAPAVLLTAFLVFFAGPGTIPEEVPTLSYWCFEPGVAMRALEALKVRCVLLTSGTLSPLDSFAQELQLEFPISLENPHVIAESQASLSLSRVSLTLAGWHPRQQDRLFMTLPHYRQVFAHKTALGLFWLASHATGHEGNT